MLLVSVMLRVLHEASLCLLWVRLGSSWLPLCAKVSGSLSTQCRRRAGWLIGMHTTNATPPSYPPPPPPPLACSCSESTCASLHFFFFFYPDLLHHTQQASLHPLSTNKKVKTTHHTLMDLTEIEHAVFFVVVVFCLFFFHWDVCLGAEHEECLNRWVHPGQHICSHYRWAPILHALLIIYLFDHRPAEIKTPLDLCVGGGTPRQSADLLRIFF